MGTSKTRFLLIALTLVLTIVTSAKSQCFSETGKHTKDAKTKLYKGQNIFTLEFLAAVNQASPNENVFFSPYSLYHVLLMLYFGSQHHTEAAIKKGLQLQWTDDKNVVTQAYKYEASSRNFRYSEDNHNIKFTSVDKLFFGKNIPVRECMESFFGEQIEQLDFVRHPDESRIYINKWVENSTHNEIKDLLVPGSITENTKLAVANAAYFKGTWLSKFDQAKTTKDIFYTKDNQTFVDMMSINGSFNHAANEKLGCHILELPYKTSDDENDESDVSMFVFLPPNVPNALETLMSRLTGDALSDVVGEGISRQVQVKLPKFSIEKTLPLNAVMQKMGMGSIFDADADFSGFSDQTQINFDEMLQKAKIVVNEEGSVAAAATVAFSFRSSRPAEPAQFFADHPFFFMIYDYASKAVLFSGIYRKPE